MTPVVFCLSLSLVTLFLSLSVGLFFFFLNKHSALSWSYLLSDFQIYIPNFDYCLEIWIHPSKGLLDSVSQHGICEKSSKPWSGPNKNKQKALLLLFFPFSHLNFLTAKIYVVHDFFLLLKQPVYILSPNPIDFTSKNILSISFFLNYHNLYSGPFSYLVSHNCYSFPQLISLYPLWVLTIHSP